MRILRHFLMSRVGLFLACAALLSMSPLGRAAASSLITGLDIVNGSIKKVDLGNGVVTGRKLAANSVSASKIRDGSIQAADLAAGVGVSGSQGDKGDKGDTGATGLNGTNGIDGADGLDGLSAYEIAVANGFVGTEVEWLNDMADADTLDGFDSLDFAPAGHDHDNRYYTEAESEARYAATDHSHDATKTAVLTIPVAAFRPASSATAFEGNGAILYATSPGTSEFIAPVSLPHGSNVIDFSIELLDNDAPGNILVNLTKSTSPMNIFISMAGVSTSAQSADWQILSDSTINQSLIDNSSAAYFVSIFFQGSTWLRASAAKITYEYTTPGG